MDRKKGKPPHIVVGLGASAGGLDALKKFFNGIGAPENMSFVLIQHLDEKSARMAHGVWSRLSKMPVREITNGMPLSAGTLYHAPSHTTVRVIDGLFSLETVQSRDGQLAVVDAFFDSIAKAFAKCSVGIVFSGEGSDGSQGLRLISDAGGMTIAQAPETTEFPSMPQSAIATGVVDLISSPADMPLEIKKYSEFLEKHLRDGEMQSLQEKINDALPEICQILFKTTRHDFKHYKTSTLTRRIQRRMQILRIDTPRMYVDKLQVDVKEADSLFKELLINVTWFFRDAEAFKALKTEVLAKALRNHKVDTKFRIWIPGCSTGEEVYTLAILIREITAKLDKPPEIQIIATDIDEAALALARKGSYPVTIAEHVSASRLKKFFTRKVGRYHVNKEIREMVLFSSHNLINDPPFSQLDLISCRNLLIYLGSHLQKKLIPVFHYALRPGGHLLLGTSESLTGHRDLFRTVSAKHRIAARKATAITPPGFSTTLSHVFSPHSLDAGRNHDADIHLISQRILLDEFAPRYAVVNDDGQIVSVSGGLAHYFDPSEGSFQNNILKLVKPSLRVGLRLAFHEARKVKRKITHEGSSLKESEGFSRIGITVQPMPQLGDTAALYMVVFHYMGRLTGKKSDNKKSLKQTVDTEIVEQLERELSLLREDLDRSVQDLEASNEELKSSNEELLSMNEELQSANEELETSKEDVQNSNDSIQRTNSDLENLMASTQIATIFLDEQFNIWNFTPQLESIYHLTRNDIGRPVSHFTHEAVHMPPFAEVGECEIEMKDGRRLLRRLTPYRDPDGSARGTVATFIDVTQIRATEERLITMVKTSPNFMAMLNGPDFVFEQANERFVELVGREVYGKTVREAMPEAEGQGFLDILIEVRRTGKPYIGREMPIMLKRKAGEPESMHYLDFVYQPDVGREGSESRIFVHGTDVTEKVLARAAIERSQKAIEHERENFRSLFRQTPEMVCMLSGPEHTFEFVNEAHIRLLGFDATGMTVRQAQPESVEVYSLLDGVYQTGVTAQLHEIPITVGAGVKYFNLTYAARRDASGNIDGIMVLGADVSAEILSRESVSSQKIALELTMRGAPVREVLEVLALMVEQQATFGAKVGIMLVSEDGKHLVDGVGPSLPADYLRAAEGLAVGPLVASCGTSAYFGKAVMVSDISSDPLWKDYREIALGHGLRACWSTPIFASSGRVLGTVALYYPESRKPSGQDERVIDLVTRTAALVIERRRAVEELSKAKDDAERANESKTRFLANMSHEIRTPLAAILGFTELLQTRAKEWDTEAAAQLDRVSRNAGQLGRLIDDLLDLSKIEAERFEIEGENFDLFAAVEDVIASAKLRITEKNLRIAYRSVGTVPREINTDPTRFRQILTNVIGNAVKFTEKGGLDIEFSVQGPKEKPLLAIRVKDTGIGLSPEHQKRIFDRFVQGDPSVTRKYGGTGLGLILSRRLAQLMGGDLVLEESRLGEGSTFLITLLLRKLSVGNARDVAKENADFPYSTALNGCHILVVDDSPDNQTIIQLFIAGAGGTSELASNGLEAVERMREKTFGSVLMDIQMPVMDGYQALKTARESGYRGPIVALTAHALKEEKEMCLDAGFTDYMSKPIDRQALIRRLATICEK